jgi:hypothetical protein
LVAVLALAAVAASSALAIKNPTKSAKIFANCPVGGMGLNGEPVKICIFGATEPKEGGQFTVGPFTVPLAKQIVLQYGAAFGTPLEEQEAEERKTKEEEEGKEAFGETVLSFSAPTHGAEAITPTAEKVPGEPIAHITPAEQNELGWSETLKYSYAQAQKHGTVKTVYETIELAGTPYTSIEKILQGNYPGVIAPVKIKGENAWISKLGDVCYIGSDAEPIVQNLTSGKSTSPLTGITIEGSHGELDGMHEGQEVVLVHSDLVDNTYAVPAAVCTGPYSTAISATINKEFGLPAPAGASITELKGSLYSATASIGELGGA